MISPYRGNAEISQRTLYINHCSAGGGGIDDNKNIVLLRLFLFYGRYYGGFTQSGNMREKLAKSTKTLKVFISQSEKKIITVLPFCYAVILKVHKIEIFFGFDFEICIISLLVM